MIPPTDWGVQIVNLLGRGTAAGYSFLLGREPIVWPRQLCPQ